MVFWKQVIWEPLKQFPRNKLSHRPHNEYSLAVLELILEIIGNIMKSTRKKKLDIVCYQVVRTKECVAVSQPKQHEATIIIAYSPRKLP